MELFDVVIVGGGPAGSTSAAFCAQSGLRTLLLEREKFPREKVCGDCLNPACWAVLGRLGLAESIHSLPHGILETVEFIATGGQKVVVDLPSGDESEIAIKRSLFDTLLMTRARELGVDVREQSTVIAIARVASRGLEAQASSPSRPAPCRTLSEFRGKDAANGEQDARAPGPHHWRIEVGDQTFAAQILVGADGRNSTIARLCKLLPRSGRERVALQAHIPLPRNFGNRVVLQFLREGYSGQAPVNDHELNLCLVGRPPSISMLRRWAEKQFDLPIDQPWRTITPLTRSPISSAHTNLLFIGDAARVVEPFTGEGIYYALRSGELAAKAITKLIRGQDRQPRNHRGSRGSSELILREFARAHAAMYRGRLWINHLSRVAVLSPRVASVFVHAARIQPLILRLLTRKIVVDQSVTRCK